jgi:hypothetical protein
MAGEEATALPVLNSQRAVPGFFLSAAVEDRHNPKANKAIKVAFISPRLYSRHRAGQGWGGNCGVPETD